MSCSHLTQAPAGSDDEVARECPDCVALGRRDWVHLRQCLACGHVGCCDSSPLKHATAHFDSVGHPVVRSVEPGESWRWCYLDGVLG